MESEENSPFTQKLIKTINPKAQNWDKIFNEIGLEGVLNKITTLPAELLQSLVSNTTLASSIRNPEDLVALMFGGNKSFTGNLGNIGKVIGTVVPENKEKIDKNLIEEVQTFFDFMRNISRTTIYGKVQKDVELFEQGIGNKKPISERLKEQEKQTTNKQHVPQQDQVHQTQKVDVNVKIDASADMQEWIRIETEKKYGIPTYPIDRFNTMISNNNP